MSDKSILKENEKFSAYYHAHNHTLANYREVMASKVCGCCYCGSIFSSKMIVKEEHTCIEPGKDDLTVICPYCSVDAVFGDASGFMPTDELLREMYGYWF